MPANPKLRPWNPAVPWSTIRGAKSKARFDYLTAYVKRNGGGPIVPKALRADIVKMKAVELWNLPTDKDEVFDTHVERVVTGRIRAIREDLVDDTNPIPRSFPVLVGFDYTFKVDKDGSTTEVAYWQAATVLKDNPELHNLIIKRIQAVLEGHQKTLKNFKDYKVILKKSKLV